MFCETVFQQQGLSVVKPGGYVNVAYQGQWYPGCVEKIDTDHLSIES
jgi:hypothetical protein